MHPAEAFAPGEHIAKELEARGVSQVAFANAMGLSVYHVHHLIYHDGMMDDGDLDAIAAYFGTSRELWENLQVSYFDHIYRELQAEQEAHRE